MTACCATIKSSRISVGSSKYNNPYPNEVSGRSTFLTMMSSALSTSLFLPGHLFCLLQWSLHYCPSRLIHRLILPPLLPIVCIIIIILLLYSRGDDCIIIHTPPVKVASPTARPRSPRDTRTNLNSRRLSAPKTT